MVETRRKVFSGVLDGGVSILWYNNLTPIILSM